MRIKRTILRRANARVVSQIDRKKGASRRDKKDEPCSFVVIETEVSSLLRSSRRVFRCGVSVSFGANAAYS